MRVVRKKKEKETDNDWTIYSFYMIKRNDRMRKLGYKYATQTGKNEGNHIDTHKNRCTIKLE